MNTNEKTQNEMKPPCGRRHLWKIPFIIAGILLIKSIVVFLLWNKLVPDLFQGPQVTFIQALGLIVLIKVLFGCGFRKFGGHRGPWKARWWANLSPEEREKFREKLHHR